MATAVNARGLARRSGRQAVLIAARSLSTIVSISALVDMKGGAIAMVSPVKR